jgi:hypothetical protein
MGDERHRPRGHPAAQQRRDGAAKANAVTSAKVKNGSLRLADFARGQLPPSLAGPKGDPGAPGAAGAPGAQGPPGLDGTAVAAAQVSQVGTFVGFSTSARALRSRSRS